MTMTTLLETLRKGLGRIDSHGNPPSWDRLRDSSLLIAAERWRLTPELAIETVRKVVGEISIVLCALTAAEIPHGIQNRRLVTRHR